MCKSHSRFCAEGQLKRSLFLAGGYATIPLSSEHMNSSYQSPDTVLKSPDRSQIDEAASHLTYCRLNMNPIYRLFSKEINPI